MKNFTSALHFRKHYLTGLGLALALSACGGGSDSGSANGGNPVAAADVPAPDAQIVSYLKTSNIDFARAANGRPDGTWRWPNTPDRHVAVYLPTPAAGNSTEADYANKVTVGVNLINAKLSGLLVLDVTNTRPASGNFIQVSYLTSYVPSGSTDYASYCANVSIAPNIGAVVVPDKGNNIVTSPVYVNLGNGHCTVTQDIVTHEFGHALGLAVHFASFGDAPVNSWNAAYFDVLATLYSNPQSTPAANIVVKRAK